MPINPEDFDRGPTYVTPSPPLPLPNRVDPWATRWWIAVAILLSITLLGSIIFWYSGRHSVYTGSGTRVANYSIGQHRTKEYEHFEFWKESDGTRRIVYSYGVREKEFVLTYLGTDTCEGTACFKVRFPNQLVLSVIPAGSSLRVVDGVGQYSKLFSWQYQDPVNGTGASDACANEEEAIALVRQQYLNQ